MSKTLKKYTFALGMFVVILLASCKKQVGEKSLLLYCAAGTKPVVEQLARLYYKEHGVRVNLQYGGSGTLLANLRIAKQGDLYLAADRSYITEAQKYGLIDSVQPLAVIKPIIAVAKGNPKNITRVTDLIKKNVKIAIANPDAASIGRLTKQMLKATKQWDSIKNHILVSMPTVSEVANAVKLKTVDAGIIWDATANQYADIDAIETPMLNAHKKHITIGVLKYSKQPEEALKFIRYLSSKDKGVPVFEALGYHPIN